jgi:hypothetical protein
MRAGKGVISIFRRIRRIRRNHPPAETRQGGTMQPTSLTPGDIMQLDPQRARGVEWFGACLLVVTEPKPWGAQGYVKNAGYSGLAFFRAQWEDMEPTGGRVVWGGREA